MKGSLHTDELMRAVTSGATGLRTAQPDQSRLHHGCADLFLKPCLSPTQPSISRRTSTPNAISCRTRSISTRKSASALRGLRCFRRSKRSPPASPPPLMPPPCARWPTAARLPAACSMGRLLSTMRSIRKRRGSRASNPRSRVGPKSWSCPTSRPGTCWPRIRSSSRRRMPPASCSPRGFRSSSTRAPNWCAAGWRPARSRCSMPHARRRAMGAAVPAA